MIVSQDAVITHGAMVRSRRSIYVASAAEFLPDANSVEEQESRNRESRESRGRFLGYDAGIGEPCEQHHDDGENEKKTDSQCQREIPSASGVKKRESNA
jgi:hypothetical protein